jgi:hypothetical protein
MPSARSGGLRPEPKVSALRAPAAIASRIRPVPRGNARRWRRIGAVAGMRLLVCGGRDFSDTESAYKVLDAMHRALGIDVLIEGNARGADRIAGYWARRNGVANLKFPADWGAHGKAAGPIRNQQMLDEGKPTHILAFPGGRGTADMVRRAKGAGLQVIIALAAAASGGDVKQAPGEAPQSGPAEQGNAQPLPPSKDSDNHG